MKSSSTGVGATEDRHHDLERVAIEVDLFHHAGEVVERAVDDLDRLAFSKMYFGFGFSLAVTTCSTIWSTSSWVSGVGFLPLPTKPVTLGVFLTTCQAASDISISTRM